MGSPYIYSCAWYSTPNRISWNVLLGRYNIVPKSHCKHQCNTDLLRQYKNVVFLLTIQCFLDGKSLTTTVQNDELIV